MSYWNSMDNQKKFMNELAMKLEIKKPSDWGKVTKKEIYELGGGSMLSYYYENSLFHCLQVVYRGS